MVNRVCSVHIARRRRFTVLSGLWVFLLTAACPVVLPQAHAAGDDEQWFAVYLDEQRAGWAHSRVVEADQALTSTTDVMLQVKRGPMTMSIQMASSFEETIDGRAIRATTKQMLGTIQITQEMTFTDEGIVLKTVQGQQVQTRTFPLPEPGWLTPAASERYIRQQTDAGAEKITFRTIDPQAGPQVQELTMRRVGDKPIEIMGRVVPAIAWEISYSGMPGMALTSYLDHEGRSLKTVMPMPGMSMTMVATDEQLAKAKLDPPELLAASLIQPQLAEPIDQPRRVKRSVIELTITGDGDRPDLPSVGYQRVEVVDDVTRRVIVDLDKPIDARDDQPTDDHKRASTMLNHEDPAVIALLEQALKGVDATASALDKALALRTFVSDHIEAKDLSVGLASAGEVARTSVGDCTEHAVLLAALLRGAGIPSRTVSGIVYVDAFLNRRGVFGYHMWTQAWIADDPAKPAGGRWIDLDPTIPALPVGFDAMHIALATSAMADGAAFNDMVALVPVFGRLTIRVLEAQE